eukprot:scaffold3968_cov92-Isochrysis_galbana.AAC.3
MIGRAPGEKVKGGGGKGGDASPPEDSSWVSHKAQKKIRQGQAGSRARRTEKDDIAINGRGRTSKKVKVQQKENDLQGGREQEGRGSNAYCSETEPEKDSGYEHGKQVRSYTCTCELVHVGLGLEERLT